MSTDTQTLAVPRPSFLRSPAMRRTIASARAAITAEGVIIYGERATGRESLARALHYARSSAQLDLVECLADSRASTSAGSPFVRIDCAGGEGCEQALFGRVTPAVVDGREAIAAESALCRAQGGTLFVRSLEDMPLRTQLRLARVFRDGEVWSEKACAAVALGARLMAAADPAPDPSFDDRLAPELRRRLPMRVSMPPLRERRDDFPALIRHALAERCQAMRLPSKVASRQAIALLAALPWRENFTELQDLLGTLVLKIPGRLIRLQDVLTAVRLDGVSVGLGGTGTLREARDRFEREYVGAVLQQHHGRIGEAAKSLGIQRTNLYRKIRQLSVEWRNLRG